ncbi:hypothetical protein C2R22_18315 [Salinigranum rubrum]|uniref:Transcription factor zinc-finger domain-containing protein n=1 Tax=Salinigranum rubrum TaxID=755307 RepID=A0A2I8VN56_9EURY|nr:hypothetical protein [Salinigranum rubrum]AUV83356.1 hypothetical protein C2R22_18315 [Salinigranum rubrum]
MDCPECGAPLATYRLGDREAPVCERCGHVGIEAEHRGARARVESWSEALRRFYGTETTDEDLTVPVRAADWGDSTPRRRVETWTEALERFYGGGDGAEANGGTGETDAEREAPTPVTFDGTPAVRRAESGSGASE